MTSLETLPPSSNRGVGMPNMLGSANTLASKVYPSWLPLTQLLRRASNALRSIFIALFLSFLPRIPCGAAAW